MQKCLTQADIEQFHSGALDAQSSDEIRTHLCDCSSCAKAYREHSLAAGSSGPATASISPDDTVIAAAPQKRRSHTPKIDGYRILGVLGQGGMGIVYRAVQTKLNRTVALKVLPAIVGSANPQAVSRFRREATAAASLHHTNIIPIYDFGESPDAYYYAMELIRGQPLDVLVTSMSRMNASVASPPKLGQLLETVSDCSSTIVDQPGPAALPSTLSTALGPEATTQAGSKHGGRPAHRRTYYIEVARWVADAADALNYAHNEGIIHRDIKPANLILSQDGRIMIADFGLAKNKADASVTMTGSLLGTLRYISPEQAQARRVPVDHRTDIYSLGATLYELLAFQPAYPGTDDKQILGAIISRDPRPPRKIVPRIPQELNTICMKMLERTPEARYRTAGEVAEDLRRYRDDLPIVAKRPSLVARTRKFVRRHRAAVVTVTSIVLLVAVTVFSFFERNKRSAAVVEGLVEEALRMQAFKDYDRAAARLRQALVRDPAHWRALANLAIVLKDQFNDAEDPDTSLLEESNALCDRALAMHANAGLWNIKGIVLKKLRRYDEAITAYQGALALAPKSVPLLGNLGVAYALEGDFDAAEDTFEQATEISGTATGCNENPWRHLGAVRLYRLQADALLAIDQTRDCKPADGEAALLRVRYHLEIPGYSNADEALIDARVADRLLRERDPLAKRLLALAFLRNGQFSPAAREAARAAELGSESVMIPLVQAISAARENRLVEARAYCDQADAAWPQDLREPQSVRVSAEAGVLWFETAGPLLALREEAHRALESTPSAP